MLRLDLIMLRLGGLEVTKQMKEEMPSAHILALTSFGGDEQILVIIKAGAMGYLLKDSLPEQLLQSIRVYQGQPSQQPVVALKLMQEIRRPANLPPTDAPLTEPESEILSLVAHELSNHEIAERLTLSERTAGNHISGILEKLQPANRHRQRCMPCGKGWQP